MVGHVEGRETGVGVAEHGLNGVVAVDAAPAAAGLPHPVEDPADVQRVVPVLHGGPPSNLLRGGAPDGGGSGLPPEAARPAARSGGTAAEERVLAQ